MGAQADTGAIRQLAGYQVRPEALTRCLAAIHDFVQVASNV